MIARTRRRRSTTTTRASRRRCIVVVLLLLLLLLLLYLLLVAAAAAETKLGAGKFLLLPRVLSKTMRRGVFPRLPLPPPPPPPPPPPLPRTIRQQTYLFFLPRRIDGVILFSRAVLPPSSWCGGALCDVLGNVSFFYTQGAHLDER